MMQRLALVIPFVISLALIGAPLAEPLADGDAKDATIAKKIEKSKDAAKAKGHSATAKGHSAKADGMKVIRVELDAEAQAKAKAEAKARHKAKAKAKANAKGGAKVKNALWWNDDVVVKALSLTQEQRNKMGALHRAFRQNVPKTRNLDAFHEALIQADWKKARAESANAVKAAMDSVKKRGGLKIDILSLLSKEQVEKLADKFPRLIYKPWRRAMRTDAS